MDKYHILLISCSVCALTLFFSYRIARSVNAGEIERITSSYTAQVTKERAEQDYTFITDRHPPDSDTEAILLYFVHNTDMRDILDMHFVREMESLNKKAIDVRYIISGYPGGREQAEKYREIFPDDPVDFLLDKKDELYHSVHQRNWVLSPNGRAVGSFYPADIKSLQLYVKKLIPDVRIPESVLSDGLTRGDDTSDFHFYTPGGEEKEMDEGVYIFSSLHCSSGYL